ncbi:MAG: hypothetical protein ACM3TU_02045 [Bacillota bacterium]
MQKSFFVWSAIVLLVIVLVASALLYFLARRPASLSERVAASLTEATTPKGTSTDKGDSLVFSGAVLSYVAPSGWRYMGKEGKEANGYVQVRSWSPNSADKKPYASLSIIVSKVDPGTTLQYIGNQYVSGDNYSVKSTVLGGSNGEIAEYDDFGKHNITAYTIANGNTYEISGAYPKADAAIYEPVVRSLISSVKISD